MKKIYLIILFISICLYTHAQNNCTAAQSHIVYAYNNAKLSLEANNITHLKFYANKSLEAFKRVEESLTNCNCNNVGDLAYMSIDKLENVEGADKMHDAQYFVGKAKKFAQEIITELDHCTVYTSEDRELLELSALEREQVQLKKEQEEIKLKQEELRLKLAVQAKQEQFLEKEQLIIQTEAAISQNIKVYNDLLDACNCKKKNEIETKVENKDLLIAKSLDEIRKHYIQSLKHLTTDYIATLDECED